MLDQLKWPDQGSESGPASQWRGDDERSGAEDFSDDLHIISTDERIPEASSMRRVSTYLGCDVALASGNQGTFPPVSEAAH